MKFITSLFLLWLGLATGRAHDPGLSTAQGQLRKTDFEVVIGFAPADVRALLPAAIRRSGEWTELEFVETQPLLEALTPQLCEVRAGGRMVLPTRTFVKLESGDTLNFHLLYPRIESAEFTVRALKIDLLPSPHRQFMMVSDERGSSLAKKLLSVKDDTLKVTSPAAVETATVATPAVGAAASPAVVEEEGGTTFWAFLKLGVEHIWTGYDHLLFLFALLVVCRSFRSIVLIISCFTLAHSLTLALTTLNWINLSGRWVEPAIAASIVFVGVENLLRSGREPPGRWALTFAFGLVHGLGFASVLRDLGVGVGGQGIAMPLFAFNVGVELGQIAIASVVLPLVWRLRKNETFVRRGIPLLSAIVAAAGLYWLLERTIFS